MTFSVLWLGERAWVARGGRVMRRFASLLGLPGELGVALELDTPRSDVLFTALAGLPRMGW
jgi:hypothetical protein